MKNAIGKKAKGIKFESSDNGISYNENMNKYIGMEGVIVDYFDQYKGYEHYFIQFPNGDAWAYPQHLIDKQFE